MTEQEWLNCSDPTVMLEFLRPADHGRKLRLLIVAFCRHRLDLVCDGAVSWIETAERFADGGATLAELQDAKGQADNQACYEDALHQHVNLELDNPTLTPDEANTFTQELDHRDDRLYATMMIHAATFPQLAVTEEVRHLRGSGWWPISSELNRCIFGNPFRRVTFDSAWRTPTVTALAQAIYAERRFADLPILADALEEVGCTSADVLDHCRSGGEHVRGCWVVELLLDKN